MTTPSTSFARRGLFTLGAGLLLGGACASTAKAPAAPEPAAAALPAACQAAPETADDRGRKRGLVRRAAAAPVLDGVEDDVWARAHAYDLVALSPEQTAPAREDFSARFRPLWDDRRLYLRVEITDDVRKSFDGSRAPHNFDQCEIYVHAGEGWGDQAKWDYGGPRQFAYELFRDPVRLKPTWKGKQKDQEVAVREVDGGWQAEVALPFAFWDLRPEVGRAIGFELHCNDNDTSDERENHLAWSDDKNEAWRSPTVIGTLTLCP
jgi:hypothetical protein